MGIIIDITCMLQLGIPKIVYLLIYVKGICGRSGLIRVCIIYYFFVYVLVGKCGRGSPVVLQ